MSWTTAASHIAPCLLHERSAVFLSWISTFYGEFLFRERVVQRCSRAWCALKELHLKCRIRSNSGLTKQGALPTSTGCHHLSRTPESPHAVWPTGTPDSSSCTQREGQPKHSSHGKCQRSHAYMHIRASPHLTACNTLLTEPCHNPRRPRSNTQMLLQGSRVSSQIISGSGARRMTGGVF